MDREKSTLRRLSLLKLNEDDGTVIIWMIKLIKVTKKNYDNRSYMGREEYFRRVPLTELYEDGVNVSPSPLSPLLWRACWESAMVLMPAWPRKGSTPLLVTDVTLG